MSVAADGLRVIHVPWDFFTCSVLSGYGFVPYSPEINIPNLSYPSTFLKREYHLKTIPSHLSNMHE